MEPTTSLVPERTPAPERQTWRSLFLGALIWFAHLNLVYGLASLACKWGWLTNTVAGVPALPLVEAALTAAAGALLLLMIYWPWRAWRRYQTTQPTRNPHLLADSEHDRRPLLAFVAMLLNSLFLLFVLGMFGLIAALQPCAQV